MLILPKIAVKLCSILLFIWKKIPLQPDFPHENTFFSV